MLNLTMQNYASEVWIFCAGSPDGVQFEMVQWCSKRATILRLHGLFNKVRYDRVCWHLGFLVTQRGFAR